MRISAWQAIKNWFAYYDATNEFPEVDPLTHRFIKDYTGKIIIGLKLTSFGFDVWLHSVEDMGQLLTTTEGFWYEVNKALNGDLAINSVDSSYPTRVIMVEAERQYFLEQTAPRLFEKLHTMELYGLPPVTAPSSPEEIPF